MTDIKNINGAIVDRNSGRKDSLIRISVKAVILDGKGHTLVVKERGRDWWDIPGGGIDHGETIKDALVRELYEEVFLEGDFEYEVLLAENPHYLESHNMYQMRITFLVTPNSMIFKKGHDADEVRFVDAALYEKSDLWTERQIFMLSDLAKNK
ncbi:NUDIX hydrolase [Candidatus Saccharibacteria bacterium]|nr:NUDIX hydrolase [Candidatus Saccharibacteria bacterium]